MRVGARPDCHEATSYAKLLIMLADFQEERLRMERLGREFSCLAGVPGVAPWCAAALDLWGASAAPDDAQRSAAQFLLAVWNPEMDWAAGRFDSAAALVAWSAADRAAFAGWAVAPWWA